MKRLLTFAVLVVVLAAGVSTAHASGPGCCTQAAAAPMPNATVAQSQPTAGYRTYSYQPGYQSDSPPPVYRSFNRSTGNGFHDAGWKIRGRN